MAVALPSVAAVEPRPDATPIVALATAPVAVSPSPKASGKSIKKGGGVITKALAVRRANLAEFRIVETERAAHAEDRAKVHWLSRDAVSHSAVGTAAWRVEKDSLRDRNDTAVLDHNRWAYKTRSHMHTGPSGLIVDGMAPQPSHCSWGDVSDRYRRPTSARALSRGSDAGSSRDGSPSTRAISTPRRPLSKNRSPSDWSWCSTDSIRGRMSYLPTTARDLQRGASDINPRHWTQDAARPEGSAVVRGSTPRHHEIPRYVAASQESYAAASCHNSRTPRSSTPRSPRGPSPRPHTPGRSRQVAEYSGSKAAIGARAAAESVKRRIEASDVGGPRYGGSSPRRQPVLAAGIATGRYPHARGG
eukprot:TRINITY_DN22361_c0_g1_i2.p1 TRINITY_DN22361_c0_g1~~TRINITY_DN22361_c0_g1_i2.p1  ORF type:complete len:377 (-),score=23.05 TRINITY_DN22361_c0_g1_i2:90-1172(-)